MLRKKDMMNITWKRLGAFLLLACALAGTGSAFAQSWGVGGNNQQDRRGNDQRQADRGDQRRDSRMSPDERRALRQQIDEAGKDIYKPRR
jgi:hypothetical protein